MTLHGPPPKAFAERRAAVRAALDGAVLFLPETPEAVYANDVHYTYRPDTNVRYLSGFEEPCALLLSNHGKEEDGFTLCVRARDEKSETWTGKRAGVEGARETYGADHAFPIEETWAVLLRQLRRADRLFYAHSRDPHVNQRVLELVHEANAERPRRGGDPIVVSEATALLAEFRLHKRPEEIDRMREAGRISAAAHMRLMETLRPGQTEYQAQALLEYEFRYGGCTGPAYGSICAGGANATVLHYTSNDRALADGELLLVDAAGEYGGYCADITRTFPVGASFSAGQAELYDIALAAQEASIEAVRPGIAIEEVHRTALRVLVEGLISIGLLTGTVDECIERNAYTPFYMHNTSHWLGMDVHDAGSYRTSGSSRVLEEGMVLTVEPGLYVRSDLLVDEKFRGVGIRIEDDILVTAGGREIMTSDVIKGRGEIEKIRKRALAAKPSAAKPLAAKA
ncbi:MAG TPA: aminopeptidase P N-terminal domain-containing protein [Candidatus Limnocylindrales bacterium]|nr:aminopeptidase P N-terminal domain-containing protein [Candidatus Limnocylindrales bacterium]